MLRISHCIDNLLTDAGMVVSITHRPRSTPHKHYFSPSGTHFTGRVNPRGLVRLKVLGKLKIFLHFI
jgi:hypothetical protein